MTRVPAPDDAAALAAALLAALDSESADEPIAQLAAVRTALAALPAHPPAPPEPDPCCGCDHAHGICAHHDLCARRAHPPAPLPLDVERMAKAMRLLPPIPEEFLVRKTWVESDWLPNARDYARAIAAEYARLATPEPTE